ncbi:methyltransferase [Halomicroarcula sp. GCM10025324]|uniref:methyltransferase n=1 Tax=Haloarcula TaxID=2237 RepID=UPI0023E777D0|nr:methyltransferase [Halomicroarcula sp. ZS-22-S1]
MTDAKAHVIDLIFGRWRSQTLYAGVELGVFDIIGDYPKHAVEIADQLDINREQGYRLFRALASLDLLQESSDRRFSITPAGELLQEDHPDSLQGIALLEEGPTHYATWSHLPAIVREGEPDGFQREFGHSVFDHLEENPDYAARFNESMSSLSQLESDWVKLLLRTVDVSEFGHICDVGGGHGHLLCTLLQDAPRVEGTVLELPSVVKDEDQHYHESMGLSNRVDFVAGDFFEEVPTADAYLMKHILHDWSDAECVEILSTVREAAPDDARLFVCELVVPGPDQSHLSKLFDIHMMVSGTGKERTEAEYAELFEKAGFEHAETHQTDEIPMAIVEEIAT